MARQLSDLPSMLSNEVRDDDIVLIRDTSSQTDKKISVAQLKKAVGGGGGSSVDYDELYPIGTVRILADDVDHSTDFGQTWERYASGKTLVGLDSSDTAFNPVGKTGGEKTHTLTIAEMPAHHHIIPPKSNYSGSLSERHTTSWAKCSETLQETSNTGGGVAHNNLQPYIVVAFWRRIS